MYSADSLGFLSYLSQEAQFFQRFHFFVGGLAESVRPVPGNAGSELLRWPTPCGRYNGIRPARVPSHHLTAEKES